MLRVWRVDDEEIDHVVPNFETMAHSQHPNLFHQSLPRHRSTLAAVVEPGHLADNGLVPKLALIWANDSYRLGLALDSDLEMVALGETSGAVVNAPRPAVKDLNPCPFRERGR